MSLVSRQMDFFSGLIFLLTDQKFEYRYAEDGLKLGTISESFLSRFLWIV